MTDVVTRGDREIIVTRRFAAAQAKVYAALTTPDLLVQWYGAQGWRLVECSFEASPGGSYEFVSEGPGGERMVQRGEVRAVEPPSSITLSEVFDEQSYPGVTLITHDLTAEGAGTLLTTTIRYATPGGRATALRYPMGRGMAEAYTKLDLLLERTRMNWTLEVVVVPVSDIDRAKAFYAGKLGFNVDHDTTFGDDVRIVQLTPPGSGCSVVIGKGAVPVMEPGSLRGLQLVVPDIRKAHALLVERGVDVSDVQKMGENPQPMPDPLDNVGFVFFDDPDGNGWAVQQISSRG
ncbi:SRPBCC domain-containing protein [Herbidospora mongoliensis]|uniref:SRPBCC domain-containing protein n=1 Tax=Herbidospora mongoliensis TaxID=688067 RepID=UPI000AB56484|nr:SRPBCC domain-containing protein [Herbidospora mongoliensis]